MSSFVLVHGGAHAAWCWERLVPLLRAAPKVDAVVAVDLPGHGASRDAKPLEAITLADYVDHVVSEIETRDLRDVVLVGHSLAGITISPAAVRLGGRLRRLVYLSTSNPPEGGTVMDMMKHPLSPLSRGVDARIMFCNDLKEADAEWLLARLGPQPSGPLHEPITIARAPAGIPATYVLLERDETLPPAYQREQARHAGVEEIVSLDAGHSAFLSQPEALAELLLGWA